MLKKLLILAFAGLLSPAHAAGTIPFSFYPQVDLQGRVMPGCKFYTIQAGTVSTPQNAYQDSALTLPLPNPQTCDASGRLPQMFLADGQIKVRLTDKNGVSVLSADNVQVVGASSGGGGGGTVDPTSIIATGDIKARYGTGVLSGFVRANGRTIGSATSGATERANADCQALFEYLWNTDSNLVVSTGRGASANADWVANKTMTLPDWRGRAIGALADMGNSATTVLTSTYFGTDPTVLGAPGGSQSHTLAISELPVLAPTFVGNAGTLTVVTDSSQVMAAVAGTQNVSVATGPFPFILMNPGGGIFQLTSHGSFTPTGSITPFGGGGIMSIASPMKLATVYLKL